MRWLAVNSGGPSAFITKRHVMSQPVKGVAAIVAACAIWGFVPLFYRLLDHVPPIEVMSHRTLWSFLFFGCVLALSGRSWELRRALSQRDDFLIMGAAALLIAMNWFFFIFSVHTNQVIESSLGYFIMPLVSVCFGLILFKERLSSSQWLAVFLATLAVVILTYGLRETPWIAFVLATSFSLYAVLKKHLSVAPMVSVTVEVLALSPFALLILSYFHWGEGSGAYLSDLQTTVLLMLSGPLTALPLILFSFGTRNVALSTAGLLQYLNPSLQFFCATVFLLEPLTRWHMLSFPLIWGALLIYSLSGIYASRSSR